MEVDNFEASTKAFSAWLTENGIKVSPKMTIADLRAEGRGRGLVAIADFEEDEVVFSVPRSAVLNVKNTAAVSSNTFAHLNSSSVPSWLALTAAMILESGHNDSRWGPYFAILPRRLDSLVFWSDSELAELQASAVTKKIGRASADALFSLHIPPLGLDNCNMEMCHQVASTIMAYAFDIPDTSESQTSTHANGKDDDDDLVSDDGEDEKTILSMIPLADLLNANADLNNARLVCDNEDLEMRTIKPIAKGEEIFNDYGQLPQSDLLRRYGYVTERYSVYDVVEISTVSIIATLRARNHHLSLEKLSEEDLQRRIELAEREGVYEEAYDLAHPGPDGPSIPDELLALLYLLLLDDTNLESILSSNTALPSRSKLTTELVGQVLEVLLHAREEEYPTILEEDKEILQAGNLGRRKEMALQVRLGEKVVLRAAVQEAKSFSGSNKRMRVPSQPEPVQKSNGKRSAEESAYQRKKGRFR